MFGSRLNREGRMVFPFAIAEAQDLGHSGLGPEHLLLGVLCNARDPLVGIFAAQNITLDSARAAVRSVADDADASEATPDEDRYAEDRDALKLLGIDLDAVREAVHKNFGDDLTFGWGKRPGKRHRGPRGDHRGHRGPCGEHDGHRGRGRGEFGPGGFGPGGFGPGQFGPAGPGPFAGRGPWGEGPFDDGEGPWDFGRGRRGPRGHGQRPRFTLAAKQAVAAAMRIAVDNDTREMSTAHLVLAILDADTPAVAAIVDLAPGAEALRQAVADQLTVEKV